MTKKICTLLLTLLFPAILPADAADVIGRIDVSSGYIWRGLSINNDPVAQPSVDISYGNFRLGFWGNIDIGDNNGTFRKGDFSEVDLTFTYSRKAGRFDLAVGLIDYQFPGQPDNSGPALEETREIFASVATPLCEKFSVAATVYYDLDVMTDIYATMSLAYSSALSEKWKLDGSALAACCGKDWAANGKFGLREYLLGVKAIYAADPETDLTLGVNYTGSLDTKVLPNQETQLFGTIGIARKF